MKLDILAIGAHPDDVELGCGATIAKEIANGKKVGIIDLTRGELGTRGNAETRDKESEAAAKILGVAFRKNMEFADGFFVNGPTYRGAAEMIGILADDQRVPACVLQHFMSYAMAAEKADLGKKLTETTVSSWTKNGLGFRDLLVSIVTSPAFKYRRIMSAE